MQTGLQFDDLEIGQRLIVIRKNPEPTIAGVYLGLERHLGGQGQLALQLLGGRVKRIPARQVVAITLAPEPAEFHPVDERPDGPLDGPLNLRSRE